MIVLSFQPRFSPLVQSGVKTQTIRGPRKRPVRVGDTLSLREWTGAPYRSKQRVLRVATCTRIGTVWIPSPGVVVVDDAPLTFGDARAFARRDGFTDLGPMCEWFENVHGLPFSGVLIGWAA